MASCLVARARPGWAKVRSDAALGVACLASLDVGGPEARHLSASLLFGARRTRQSETVFGRHNRYHISAFGRETVFAARDRYHVECPGH